jgi:hypothetical protein
MTATHAPPEELLDDSAPEDRLQAALRVHAGDLLEFAGQLTVENGRDGVISRWLWGDIRSAVRRLNQALTEFSREKGFGR